MREIKFRAWDKKEKVMRIPKTYECSDLNAEITFIQQEYILMQFTGLKDKNGKEIYEGDIVQYYSKGYEVYWINGKFMGCNDIYPENNDYEIIGNIYENPELLTTN